MLFGLFNLFKKKPKAYKLNLGVNELRKITQDEIDTIELDQYYPTITTLWTAEKAWWKLNYGLISPTATIHHFLELESIIILSDHVQDIHYILLLDFYQENSNVIFKYDLECTNTNKVEE